MTEILIIHNLTKAYSQERDLGIAFFRPTTEPETSTEEVFLPANPEVLMEAGKFHKVPFITGVVGNEGIFTVKGTNHFTLL
jgi:hypothetical protein